MKLLSRGLLVLTAALAVLGSVAAAAVAAPSGAAAATPVRTVKQCGAAAPGHMRCFALRRTDVVEPGPFSTSAVTPDAVPSGFGPSDLRSAYNLPAGTGAPLVAVVDALNDPNAAADLATYRAQYGLAACTVANGCFSQVNQNGASSPLPANDSGWAGEESLDVDMVSAICPSCHIVLVEANSATDADLYAAEDRAVALGAKYVSNSWGGGESAGQTTDDAHFNHAGVAITVSSGDDATGAEYPASSRYVTAVGGTSLSRSTNARGWNETAWSDAGSGCSAYDAKPTWQTVTTSCARRAEADVSAVADPNTGVAVYQTYGASGWVVYGGTSVAAPVIAGVYALAGTPAAGSYPASTPYAHTANLYDVTSGSNGSCGAPLCTAGVGWDGPTGLGTPNGVSAFGGTTSTALTLANPGNQSGNVGTATSVTLAASGGTTPYTFSASGLPTGLTVNSSTGVISGTPTSPGSFATTVKVADAAAHSASASFTWTEAAASSCTGGQRLGNPGFETGSAAPWTATAGVIDSSSAEPAHSGSWKAWMDGYGTTHTDTLTQSVTVPTGCTHTALSFYLHIDTAETTTTTQYDKLTVKVGTTTVGTYSNLNHNTGYALQSIPLGSYAGQTVTVAFSGAEDSSLQTSFVVDDTAFTVS